jgi:hypothetical protein
MSNASSCPPWCDFKGAHHALRITGGPPAQHESRPVELPATDPAGATVLLSVWLLRVDDADGPGRVSVALATPAETNMLPSEAADLGRALVRFGTLGLPDEPARD